MCHDQRLPLDRVRNSFDRIQVTFVFIYFSLYLGLHTFEPIYDLVVIAAISIPLSNATIQPDDCQLMNEFKHCSGVVKAVRERQLLKNISLFSN